MCPQLNNQYNKPLIVNQRGECNSRLLEVTCINCCFITPVGDSELQKDNNRLFILNVHIRVRSWLWYFSVTTLANKIILAINNTQIKNLPCKA